MFDLEQAIAEWRRTMRRSPSIEESDLAELERYLRDKIDDLGREGLGPEEAFRTAKGEFEKAPSLDQAYGHARAARPGRRFPWRPSRFDLGLLGSHFRIAVRRLWRQKAFSLINIGGLALGLACALLIFLWVRDEWAYDRFHAAADRIVRIVSSTSEDGAPTNANSAFGLGPALKKDFPEVLETVRIKKMDGNPKRYVGYREKKFYELRLFFAEPSVFSVFDFPLLKGDPATALKDPGSIVLTEDMARKYFGAEEPMGQILESDPYGTGTLMLFRVTGVARNAPRRSHFHFDFLASYASLTEDTQAFSPISQHYTYALLENPATTKALRPRLSDFLKRNWSPDPWYSIGLQPLLDIHLRSGLRSEIEPVGSLGYVTAFSAIAMVVLLIACINFMNLSTARSAQRAKEVGIRKAVGASKAKLVRQFIGEALTISLLAAGAAVLLVLLLLPGFNRIWGKDLPARSLADPVFLLTAAAVALLVGFVSGTYPAFYLAALPPVHVLRAKSFSSRPQAVLRRGLVVLQFTLSIAIICATLAIRGQMRFIQARDVGYPREQIVALPLNQEVRRSFEAFRTELLRNPAVENASTSDFVPTIGRSNAPLSFEGGEKGTTQVVYAVGQDFAATYGLRLLAGRWMARIPSGAGPAEMLISELSSRRAGYGSPQEAIGKRVEIMTPDGSEAAQVVGVVNDIHIASLRQPSDPIVFVASPVGRHGFLSLRIQAGRVSEALAHIRRTWRKIAPSYPLDPVFLDDSFEQLHQAERKLGWIFTLFSALAIAIACLGLFGLAAHMAERRTKEIGIRKVLGASTAALYLCLSRDLLKWVVLANLFAWPVAFAAMQSWLRNFAFRAPLGWGIFVLGAGLALAVAALTVGSQTLRTIRRNPVDSLRYE